MSVAISTSKRKFHKLLDSLTNSSQTSLPLSSTLRDKNGSSVSFATAGTPEPPSKRSRHSGNISLAGMDRPASAASVSSRPVSRSSSVVMEHPSPSRSVRLADLTDRERRSSSIRLVGNKDREQAAQPRRTPNYAPWSHELFVARLKTFADVKLWTPKPDKISEVEWAKRGWVCEGVNRVACKGGCEQRVVVRLRPKRKDFDGNEIEDSEDMSVEIADDLVDRYAGMIITGHDENCLWRRAGCKDDIYHIPIASTGLPKFKERYDTFLDMLDQLPHRDHIVFPGGPPEAFFPHGELDPQSRDSFSRPSTTTTVGTVPSEATTDAAPPLNYTAAAFALFGWQGQHNPIDHGKYSIAVCEDCQARIGLWMYTKEDIDASPSKYGVQRKLDLHDSHRIHCPWTNPSFQANPTDSRFRGMACWEMVQENLKSRVIARKMSLEREAEAEGAGVPQTKNTEELKAEEKARESRLANIRKGFKKLSGLTKKHKAPKSTTSE